MTTLIEPLQRPLGTRSQAWRRPSAAPMISRFSAHLGCMFADEPLEKRFHSAAESGFQFVEHPDPYEIPAARLKKLLRETGLQMSRIALPFDNARRGERGLACLAGRDAEFRETVERGTDYAAEIGCGMVQMMAGALPAGKHRRELWPVYLERLQSAAEAAARRCQTVLIEPVGVATFANYFINDAYAALRAVDTVDARNVRLLFDAFHASSAGIDAVRFAYRHADDIAHIHIADCPGRNEPGTGIFQFGKLFGALDAAGYQGLIGLDYVPRGDTREGLVWLEDYAF